MPSHGSQFAPTKSRRLIWRNSSLCAVWKTHHYPKPHAALGVHTSNSPKKCSPYCEIWSVYGKEYRQQCRKYFNITVNVVRLNVSFYPFVEAINHEYINSPELRRADPRYPLITFSKNCSYFCRWSVAIGSIRCCAVFVTLLYTLAMTYFNE